MRNKPYGYVIGIIVSGIVIVLIQNPYIEILLVGTLMVLLFYMIREFQGDLSTIETKVFEGEKVIEESTLIQKENQMLIETLSNLTESGVVLLDTNGIIKFFNNQFDYMFQDAKVKLIQVEELDFGIELNEFFQKAYLNEKNISDTFKKDGRYYNVISSTIFKDTLFWGCLIFIYDVTERRAVDKVQKTFIEDASHELKTPVTAIKGGVEILLSQSLNEAEMNKFLKLVEKENNRMEMIINDLLKMSEIDKENYKAVKTQTNLKKYVYNIVEEYLNIAKDKGLYLEYDLDEVVGKIDQDKFKYAISNLIQNAINYTDKGGIEITLKETKKCIEFIIKDTGIGIHEEAQKHIFERFYRVDKARTRNTGGTGLGLSIVRSIVEKQGGNISLVSKVGEGSKFVIEIPK